MSKKNTFLSIISIAIFSILILFQTACNKDENNDTPPQEGTADFKVSLENTATSRSSYSAVNLDIKQISIHSSTDSSETSGWFDIETTGGIYNLLDYSVGNDTVIALDSVLLVQTVSQIRLVLGENNTVVDDGETYDLETPSAQTSGIKVQIHAVLQPNLTFKVILDFDAEESIIKTGNDKYKLKPVINAIVIQD